MSNGTDLNESCRVQLSELNARARNHMGTLWQMPTAYLAIVMVALGDVKSGNQKLVGCALCLAGIAALVAMCGALEGTHRAVDHINVVEKQLGSDQTAKKCFWLHAAPYFAMVAIGVLISMLAALSAT